MKEMFRLVLQITITERNPASWSKSVTQRLQEESNKPTVQYTGVVLAPQNREFLAKIHTFLKVVIWRNQNLGLEQ